MSPPPLKPTPPIFATSLDRASRRASASTKVTGTELEKKIEKLEHRNEMLMETLEKSDYEYAREVVLIQAEHERMLAVVSGGRLV